MTTANLIYSMNPGTNEFQSSSYNFLKFVEDPMDKEYGFSFVSEFLQFIPRWLLPNKPAGLAAQFRDRYYPELKVVNQGAGYSSFIEGYINFGFFGIFIYFFFLDINIQA